MATTNNIWGSSLYGHPSDWQWDAENNKMVNVRTGRSIDLSTFTGGTWTSTSPPLAPPSAEVLLQREAYSLQKQVSEYEALRVYLGINHKQLLVEFDVAYAARKRIGVEGDSNG